MARKKPLLFKQRVRGQNYAGQEQSFGAAKLSLLFSSAEPWKTMQLWTWKATVEKRPLRDMDQCSGKFSIQRGVCVFIAGQLE